MHLATTSPQSIVPSQAAFWNDSFNDFSDRWPAVATSPKASCNLAKHELVWAEGLSQAHGMLQYWAGKDNVKNLADDTRTYSLHVLASAGFGRRYPFQSHLKTSSVNVATSYKELLQMILDNCIPLMVCGVSFLSKTCLPTKLKRFRTAVVSFRHNMTEVYEEEKASMAQRKPQANNLITSLIRSAFQPL